jgi:hypothetical protein
MPLTPCQSSMTLAADAESSKVHYQPFIMRAIAMNIAPIPFRLYWLLLFHKCISFDVSYSALYIFHCVGLVNQDPECMKNGQQVMLGGSNSILAKRTDKCKKTH